MQQFFTTIRMVLICSLFMQGAAYGNNGSLLRHIFGSQEATKSVQLLSAQADERTGFITPVFQMNEFAKLLGYSSFNWFNTTWVDEEALEDRSDKSIVWQLVHEKYHTLVGHDFRRVIGVGAVSARTALIVRDLLYKQLRGKTPSKGPIIVDISWQLLTLFLFLWHEEYCERAADAYADRVMHEQGADF